MKFFLKGPFNLNFGNFNFYAYPQKADYTKFMLTRVELPDPRERKIIKQNLNGEQNLFIDCGANAGFYSLDIWSSVNNCKIYAFEPSVKERYFLNENLKLNKAEEIKVIEGKTKCPYCDGVLVIHSSCGLYRFRCSNNEHYFM